MSLTYCFFRLQVWNEPSSTIELGGCCPFWTGSARQYAELYAATHRAIAPEFTGGTVRIGAAVNGALSQEQCPPPGASEFDHCFDWHILTNISALGAPLDFVEFHWYGRQPALLPQVLVAEGSRTNGKLSVEGGLVAAGFPRTTPILLGEWSRFIPMYAMDATSAAFLACSLVGLNTVHPDNSDHAVEDSFVFSAGKVWSGQLENAPNLHAGVLWEAWHKLNTRSPLLLNTSVTIGGELGSCTDGGCCEFHALAASDGGAVVSVLLASYNSTGDPEAPRKPPPVGAPHDVTLRLTSLPWPATLVHWRQFVQTADGVAPGLRLARQGTMRAGAQGFEQQLSFNTNAYSVVEISKHVDVPRYVVSYVGLRTASPNSGHERWASRFYNLSIY